MSDETEQDIISSRGLRHTNPVIGVPSYGHGHVRVYESSAASTPRVWVEAMDEGATATVHLELRDALKFAENIIRVCREHYQTQGGGSDAD